MREMAIVRNLAVVVLGMASWAATAGEWPQFRGPTGQGHSLATGLPVTWSETENVRWKTSLPGKGWSSPVVAENRVWVTAAENEGKSLRILGLDRATGQLRVNIEGLRVSSPPPVNAKNGHASPTPVLDGKFLYAHFGTMGTACVDTATNTVVWTNQKVQLDHKEGPGSSPIVWRDLLIFHADGMDTQTVVALHKKDGTIAWQTPRSGARDSNPDLRKAYSTPLIIPCNGHEELISVGADRAYGYDPAHGTELWHVNYKGFSNIPRPVWGHGLVYVITNHPRPELWAVQPGGNGDVTSSHVRWKHNRQMPSCPSPVLVEDIIYTTNDQGVFNALSATSGTVIWTRRVGGNFSASPLYADGRIYCCGENGKTLVLRPGKEFHLLATNVLPGRILASPAVAGKAIFIRTDSALFCLESISR